MKYKLMNDVFYKKISDSTVNVVKYNDDDFVYKLNNVVASVFLLLVNGSEDKEVVKTVENDIKQPAAEIVGKITKDLVELNFITED